jgi:hypothetical protein
MMVDTSVIAPGSSSMAMTNERSIFNVWAGRSVVVHEHRQFLLLFRTRADLDDGRIARLGVLHGIREEVDQYLTQ